MSDSPVAYGFQKNAALASKNGKIAWIGSMQNLPTNYAELTHHVYNVQGRCLTPGLIDCHTHLVYAGNRANEFEMRLNGVSYSEIAKNGGGIQSTVNATRSASEETLFAQSIIRAQELIKEGVTTIEIKSGYGLDLPSELKILRVAKRIEEHLPVHILRTFLGAHSIPNEFKERPNEYIDIVCKEMIPVIAKEKLAHAVDVFCENIAFNLEQTKRVFETAKKHGLQIKCHSEQLSNSGSAELSAQYGALSADHLEYLSESGVEALAKSNTAAVLLPGAFYFLRETKFPPIDLLRKYKVPIAIATDCNPGTSPTTSLLLMLNMACTLFRFTPEEALIGVTRNAAKALGIENSYGTLEVGKKACMVSWDITHPAELSYQFGFNPYHQSFFS